MACSIDINELKQLANMIGADLTEINKIAAEEGILQDPIAELRNKATRLAEVLQALETFQDTRDNEKALEKQDALKLERDMLQSELSEAQVVAKGIVKNIAAKQGVINGLQVAESRVSVLGMVDINEIPGFNNSQLKRALTVIKSKLDNRLLKPTMNEGSSEFGRTKDGLLHSTYASKDPGLAIIRHKDNKLDDNVVMAMTTAVVEFMDNTDGYEIAKSIDEVVEVYNLNSEMLDLEPNKFMAIVNQLTTGKPAKVAAYDVGRRVMELLSIEFNKEPDVDTEAKMITSLGNTALQIAIEAGMIYNYTLVPRDGANETKAWLDSDENPGRVKIPSGYFKGNDINNTFAIATTLVKVNPEYKRDNIRSYADMLQGLLGEDIKVQATWLDEKPATIKGRAQIHNGNGMTVATKEQTEALNALRQTKYIDNGAVDVILEAFNNDMDMLKAYLGKVDEDSLKAELGKSITYDTYTGQISKNRAIDRQVDSLMDLHISEKAKQGIYFDWFVTVAGRFNMNSVTVNPQTDKEVTRWALVGEEQWADIDTANEQQMNAVYWTIGQAFGEDVDKMPDADAYRVGKEWANKDDMVLIEALKDPNRGHIGQKAAAIKAIRDLRNGGVVKVGIAAEIDGRTNGFAIRLLQFPFKDYKEYLPKVGIFTAGTEAYNAESIGEVFQSGKALVTDTYLTTGKIAGEILKEKLVDPVNDKDKARLEKLIEVEALPDILSSDEVKVNSVLRKLAKPPTMTFNYSAGKESIINGLVNDIVVEHADKLLNFTKAESMIADLKKKPIQISKHPAIEEYKRLIREYYAEPMYEALERQFREYIEFNSVINGSYRLMYNIVKSVIDRQVNAAKVDGKLSKEAQKQILMDVMEVLPGVMGRGSMSKADKLLIVNRALEDVKSAKVEAKLQTSDGLTGITLQAMQKWLASPGNSGSVLSVHNQESSIMSEVIKEHKVLGVHDAIVSGVDKLLTVGKQYNKVFYKANMEFSMLEELKNQLVKVRRFAKENGVESITESIIQESYINKTGDEKFAYAKMNVDAVLVKLSEFKNAMDSRRNEMDNTKMKVVQMNGPKGVEYTTEGKEVDVVKEVSEAGEALAETTEEVPVTETQEIQLKDLGNAEVTNAIIDAAIKCNKG